MNETEKAVDVADVEPVLPRAPRPSSRKKRVGAIGGVLAVAVLAGAAGAAYYFDLIPNIPGTTALQEEEKGTMVASVNGIDISRTELDKKVQEVVAQYSMTPEQAADAAFELQVLDEIINLRLLTAEAEKQGFTVSDEDVNTELNNLIDAMGGQEVYQTQLAALEMNEQDLRKNMRNEIAIRKLLEARTNLANVSVSDEEVAAMYEEAVAMAPEGQEIPPLEEVSEIARGQLVQQKSGEIVTAYIEQLRTAANIEITL